MRRTARLAFNSARSGVASSTRSQGNPSSILTPATSVPFLSSTPAPSSTSPSFLPFLSTPTGGRRSIVTTVGLSSTWAPPVSMSPATNAAGSPSTNHVCGPHCPTSHRLFSSSKSPMADKKQSLADIEKSYKELIDGNREWVKEILKKDPGIFDRLAKGQSPQTLWIGCSDSRVPANMITNTDPGQIFVHRNIANTVVHTDVNLLSVLQFAVDVLQVKHVIVCGHYGCGGVIAAMTNNQYGMVDNWLRNIKDEYLLYRDELEKIDDNKKRAERMTELHVIEGVYNVCRTSIIKDAWERRKNDLVFPHVHGWVYSIANGHVKDLGVTIRGPSEVPLLVRNPVEPSKCV